MKTFAVSDSALCKRPHGAILPTYSDVQRIAQWATASEIPVNPNTIGSFVNDWPSKLPFELDVLSTIERQGTDLAFSRAEADLTFYDRETLHVSSRVQAGFAYRLSSGRYHSHFVFSLLPFRAGVDVQTIFLEVDQQWRGRFFSLRRFLIDEVVEKTLFALKTCIVYRIMGHASSKVMPCEKLIRLYERLGAVKMPNTVRPIMVIVNPRAAEFLKHVDPLDSKCFREARTSERRRVPPLPNYRQAALSCQ